MKRTLVSLLLLWVGWVGVVQAQETVVSDTVRCWECDSVGQPTDNHYRVVTNKFGANWFILANAGGHAFLGDYWKVGKFSGLISPDVNVGVGRWFTPGIGAKLQFGLGNSLGYSKEKTYFTYGDWQTNADGIPYLRSKNRWWDLNVSAMFNLSRLFCGYEGKVSDELMNQFIASVGIGGLHHRAIPQQRNEWSGHFELQYSRFFDKEKKFSLDLKARAMLYQTNFDAITLKKTGEKSTWFDANLGFSIGFTYYFKKRHWDRCLPNGRPVYNIHQTIIMPDNDCPEYGVLEFFVFFPNNYSGRDDAPTVPDAPVNAIDYLAAGIFTQTKFNDERAVIAQMERGGSLAMLQTSDIPTEKPGKLKFTDGVVRGYEMSNSPISLSMKKEQMMEFKNKTGYFYAPIYNAGNTWHYRVDRETAMQRLIKADNYMEEQSFSLNAHQGLDIVRNNMNLLAEGELFSFADVYAAIEDDRGNVASASDPEAVEQLRNIFKKGRILFITSEGLATSQDNFIGDNSEQVGLERNKKLAYSRAFTITNWLKSNRMFRNVAEDSFLVNALVNPVVEVNDESVQGLNAKLKRSVKVRIYYVIDNK